MQHRHLPIELWDIVIDNLDGFQDTETLCACSLACKAFLHASRRQLYYHVDILKIHTARLFTRTLHSSSSLPNPSSYVRQLKICAEGDWGLDSQGLIEELNEVLFDLATCLLDVTILALWEMNWTLLDERSRSAMMTGFQNVKHLKMVNGRFQPGEMSRFIATFPCLNHLSCCVVLSITNIVPETPLPVSLEQVDLSSDLATYFDKLFRLEQHPELHTVTFFYISKRNVAKFDNLLRTLGSSIKHLNLNDVEELLRCQPLLSESASGEDMSSCINLSHNDNLRSIYIDCGRINRNTHPNRLPTLFSGITSPHMEEVYLYLAVIHVSELGRIDWHRLDQILTQPQWGKLRKLEITLLCHPKVWQDGLELVKARLPRLGSQGTRILFPTQF